MVFKEEIDKITKLTAQTFSQHPRLICLILRGNERKRRKKRNEKDSNT